jgi:hypothetical protein
MESHNEFRLTIRTAGLDAACFGALVALILFAGRTKAAPGICLFALEFSKYTLQLHSLTLFNSFCFGMTAVHGDETVNSKTRSIDQARKEGQKVGKTRVFKVALTDYGG